MCNNNIVHFTFLDNLPPCTHSVIGGGGASVSYVCTNDSAVSSARTTTATSDEDKRLSK